MRIIDAHVSISWLHKPEIKGNKKSKLMPTNKGCLINDFTWLTGLLNWKDEMINRIIETDNRNLEKNKPVNINPMVTGNIQLR